MRINSNFTIPAFTAISFCLIGGTVPAAAEPPALPVVRAIRISDRMLHWQPVTCIAFSPDGKSIASASNDTTVVIWSSDGHRELCTFRGHQAAVTCVRFSPDGRMLVSGDHEGIVKVWEAATGHEVHTLNAAAEDFDPRRGGQGYGGSKVAFSPNGEIVAAAIGKMTTLWSVETGQELIKFREQVDDSRHGGATEQVQPVTGIAFSPDGTTLATSTVDQVSIRSVETGETIRTFDKKGMGGGPYSHHTAAFSPDGTLLASAARVGGGRFGVGGGDGVQLWSVQTGEEVRALVPEGNLIQTITFDADGRTLAVSTNTITLFSPQTGEVLGVHKVINDNMSESNERIDSMALSPDGRTVAYSYVAFAWYTRTVRAWSVGAPDESAVVGRDAGPYCAAFSPDGALLAAATSRQGRGEIILWSATTGRKLRTLLVENDAHFTGIFFSPDGKVLAACSVDVQENQPRRGRRGEGGRIQTIAIDSGEVLGAVDIASAGFRSMLFDLFFGGSKTVAFSPDGTKLAVTVGSESARGRPGTVRLFDVPSLKELRTIGSQPGGIVSLAFSPDGKTLASGGGDGRVTLWSVQTGAEKLTFDGDQLAAPVVAFSSDGETIISGQVHDLSMWSTETGQPIASYVGQPGGINAILSPDGSMLARSYLGKRGDRHSRGLLTLTDTATGFQRKSWVAPGLMILLGFSSDGRTLATANANGTGYLVELPAPGELNAQRQLRLLRHADAGLPDEEQPRYEGRRVVYWLKRLAQANVPNEIFGSPDRRPPTTALRQMGPAAVPAIIDALRHNPLVFVRTTAAELLPTYGEDARAATPTLLEALKDENMALAAAKALRKIDPRACNKAIPILIERLADRSLEAHAEEARTPQQMQVYENSVMSVVAALIGNTGGRRGLRGERRAVVKEWAPLFIAALQDPEPSTQTWAARSLAQLGSDAAAAVPVLIELLSDKDDSVRKGAADTLRAIGLEAGAAVPALIEALPENNGALRALQRIEPTPMKEDVPALAENLTHRHPGTRMYAADRLRQLGPDAAAAVGLLIELLGDETLHVRRSAVRALQAVGPEAVDAVPALIDRMRHDEQGIVRRLAVSALASIDAESATVTEALLDALKDDDSSVAIAAAKAIGPLGPDAVRRAMPRLTERLSAGPADIDAEADQNNQFRKPTIQQLVEQMIGKDGFQNRSDDKEEWIALLITALEHDDVKTSRWAARSLEVLGRDARAAVPSLVAAIEDEDGAVRSLALRALMKVDLEAAQGVVPMLIAALKDRDSDTRRSAATSLGILGPHAVAAVPALMDVLKDKTVMRSGTQPPAFDPQSAAIFALGEIGPEARAAVPALTALVNDENRFLRSWAAEALKKIGSDASKGAVVGLVEALKDPDVETRLNALGTLGAIGPHASSAVPTLIDLLKDDYRIVRMSAARVLGAIGPDAKAAIPALTAAVRDADPTVRKAAEDALKLVQAGASEPPKRTKQTLLEAAKQMRVAAMSGDVTSASALLKSSPGVLNAKVGNAYGSTPLHFAAFNGRIEIVKLLLAHKADVNAVNRYGLMPLHDAAGQGHEEIVATLLDHGSEVDVKDKRGKTPLEYAVQKGHGEVADLLRGHGAKDDRIAAAVPRTAKTMFIDTYHDNFTFAGDYPGMKAVFEKAGYEVYYSEVPLVTENISGIGRWSYQSASIGESSSLTRKQGISLDSSSQEGHS